MSKEAKAEPLKEEIKAPEAVPPVVEKTEPAKVEAAPQKPVATAAAIKKVAPKTPAVKKTAAATPAKKPLAEKAAPTPKAPAKSGKKTAPDSKAKATEAPTAEKAAKVKKQAAKKPKLVRDSFTIPEEEYALFASLKQRALSAEIELKKSEVLRAALVTLAKLRDTAFAKAIGEVERIKTGRPKK